MNWLENLQSLIFIIAFIGQSVWNYYINVRNMDRAKSRINEIEKELQEIQKLEINQRITRLETTLEQKMSSIEHSIQEIKNYLNRNRQNGGTI
jgi:23S rRNA maturation mini-RNase III